MAEPLLRVENLVRRVGGLSPTPHPPLHGPTGGVAFTPAAMVALPAQPLEGHFSRLWGDPRKEKTRREAALSALTGVGRQPRAGVAAPQLSHGDQRQPDPAGARPPSPQLLLLDEPM